MIFHQCVDIHTLRFRRQNTYICYYTTGGLLSKKKVKISLTVSQLSSLRENYFHPLSSRIYVTTEIRSRHAGTYVVRQGAWYCTYCLLLSLSIAHSTRRNWITASFTAQAYRKFDEGFLQSWEASLHLVVANTLWRRHTQYQTLRQLPSWHKCQISRKLPIPLRVGNHMKICAFVSEILYTG